tara:strand:+ start:477 stop:1613 length:1137 start_codon:yes stop_codon:yes gene_type:complete
MATRNVAMTITFVAWDTGNNVGKTGDNGNITLRWIKDGTASAPTNSSSEVDSANVPGVYKITLTATETDCNIGTLAGKSTTADIVVLPITIQFERLPDADPAANGGLPTVDANNHVNGVQDTLSVNVTQIEGSDATDQINAACDASIETYGLDHLVSASVAGSDVADNSIVAKLVSKESTADWDDYVNTTESLQALRDRGDSAWTTGGGGGGSGPTAAEIRAEIDSNSTQLAAIVADTNELQTDWANGGRLDLLLDSAISKIDVVDGIVDNILVDTAEIGTAGAGLTAVPWNSAWDAEVQSECADALTAHWTTTMTESYASDNAAATPVQMLHMIYCAVGQFKINSTTITGYQIDGSTTAMTWTMDDASNPTERKRAT